MQHSAQAAASRSACSCTGALLELDAARSPSFTDSEVNRKLSSCAIFEACGDQKRYTVKVGEQEARARAFRAPGSIPVCDPDDTLFGT